MKTAKYFTATWCGPCKAFKPVMNEVASEGYSVKILDIDQNKDLAQQYNVRSVPTTIIEQNGQEVDRFIGGLPKQNQFDSWLGRIVYKIGRPFKFVEFHETKPLL